MSASAAERDSSSKPTPAAEARRDGTRRIRDVWRRLGTSGEASGTSGGRALLASYAFAAVSIAAANVMNVITTRHEAPQYGLLAPIVWEASSWLGLMAFLWIPWCAYRLAPPTGWPRWRLALHLVAAPTFSLAHVAVMIGVRTLAYTLAGARYDFGPFLPRFGYEFAKDALTYAIFIASFVLVDRLLRQGAPAAAAAPRPPTLDIRDGARLSRVRVDQILAVASAGNYVEFVLDDGRRLLMRSPLSALESELAPRGFLRTHRSWLVNPGRMTGLKPEGSGDYTIELGALTAPLSRRFPAALEALRGASSERRGVGR